MTYTPGIATTPEEDELQSRVAKGWSIARTSGLKKEDSREGLEALGFSILKESELFYRVTPPEGFTKSTQGYWTEVFDATGKKVVMQFYKSAPWDTDAFMHFEK